MKERLPGPWRNGILVMALLINSVIACGQLKITGTIRDSTRGPLAYASIKLLKDSITLVQAVYSDSTGTFVFSAVTPGVYLVEGSYVGNKARTGRFRLDNDTALALFARSQPARILKEVTVTAAKPMIERKIDRMVFNVESSLAARGTDLTEALAMTPLLRVDDNGVSIIGKSGVAVMINERMLNLSGSDLINYLKSLRSDDIERIEVITAPPARYEAQGNSGLINIVLKKNPNIGWSGNLSPSYTQASYPGYANNFNLNYQSHRLSSSLRLWQYDRMTHPTEDIDIIGTNSILSSDSRKDVSYGWGANLGVDYKINEKAVIGFIYDIGRPHYDIDITNSTTYQYNAITDSVLSTLSKQRNITFTQTLSLYYDQKLGKAGAKLSNGFNFFSTMPGTTVDFRTQSDQSTEPDSVRNTSNQGYTIWSAQSDLSLPGKWALVETGLKYTNFDNNSATGYYNVVQQDYQEDSTKSNRFILHEQNLAGYISSQKDFNKKWSVKAGLRYEYSIIDGHSPDSTTHNAFQYGKWFPTLYISYKAGKDHTFSFNYSKRINRPNFRQLSPFRWYTNPYSYYTGNPLLQPSYNHNVELAYLYKSIFSFTLYAQKLLNGYGGIVEVNGDRKVVVYENYLNKFSAGVEATFGLKILPWWEHRDVMSFDYSHSSSSAPQVVPVQGFSFYYSTYNTFTVTRVLSLLLNFSHSLPANVGNVHDYAHYTLSTGARLALGKVQVNVTLNDILRSAIDRGIIYYQGYEQYFREYYDYRRVGLALTYKFGKTKVKGSSKEVNFKETQRAN